VTKRRERTKEMAGWEAHARPLPGPLSPRGPQPTVSIVSRPMRAFHGPLATSKGVRLFSTDALPGWLTSPSLSMRRSDDSEGTWCLFVLGRPDPKAR
jgi:hypothetical protein